MTDALDPPGGRRVWVTVIDPQKEDGRTAITDWDDRSSAEWAVPADAKAEDLVLGWVTGGTGFRYVFRIDGSPVAASQDEVGPQQASLDVVEPITPFASHAVHRP